MNFIGIDVHKDELTVANINENLEIEFVKDMNIMELIHYLQTKRADIIAVDAPYKLNIGLMNDEKYRISLNPNIKDHYNKKVSEYELSRRGINPFSTPGSMEEVIGWNIWMKTGFDLYEKLEELQYKELNINTYKNDFSNSFVEVFPHACFTVLLGHIPSKKSTLDGLTERIAVLNKIGFKEIEQLILGCSTKKKTDRLDALIAAYTSYLCFKKDIQFVGDVNEGQIVIPTTNLMQSYKKIKIK